MPIKLKMRMCVELYSTLLYELLNVVGFASYNYEGKICECCWICLEGEIVYVVGFASYNSGGN